jgi:hypothetical protein
MTNPLAVLTGPLTTGPIRRLWEGLQAHLRPLPIATVDSFKTFLEQRAALIAQKCAIDYCRGKTGAFSHALFTEEAFIEALTVCRWETFAAVLGDLFIVAEGHLRPYATEEQRTRLRDALLTLYGAILDSQPVPGHRSHGWGDAIADLTARLTAASAAEPQHALDVADHSARRLFDTLPIHSSMRALDEEVVFGAVRFRMVAISQEMQRRVAAADVVKELLANVTP